MASHKKNARTKKETSLNPLENLLGNSHIDFLQTVYDIVFYAIHDNVETRYTIENQEELEAYSEKAKVELLKIGNPAIHIELPNSEEEEATNAHLLQPFADGVFYAPIPSVADATIGNRVDAQLIQKTKIVNTFIIRITLREAPIQPVRIVCSHIEARDWARLALFGLDRLGSIVFEQLSDEFYGILNDKYVVNIEGVSVSPSNPQELETSITGKVPRLGVLIRLSLTMAEDVLPGGEKCQKAEHHFVSKSKKM